MKEGRGRCSCSRCGRSRAAHGVGLVAERSRLGRESLYRTLSGKGNPTLETLMRVLDAAGLKLSVAAKKRVRRAA